MPPGGFKNSTPFLFLGWGFESFLVGVDLPQPVRPVRVVRPVRISPLQFTGGTVFSVQLLPNASAAREGSHSKQLGEGMSWGRRVCPKCAFLVWLRVSDPVKPLSPAQRELLGSKCFNCCRGQGLGSSLPHRGELKGKGILLYPWKVRGPESSSSFKANWNHWGCKSVGASECASLAALWMS